MLLYSDPGGADNNTEEHAIANKTAENTDATNNNNNSDDSEDDEATIED